MLKVILRLMLAPMVWLYQRTHGKIGGRVQGLPVLLLTTTGRKPGKKRVTPLGYLETLDGDRGTRPLTASRRIVAKLVERSPGYAVYQNRTTREIPLVVLRPHSPT
jgi:hypothetical protein